MGELTVAGWLVSPMIKVMVDKARSYIGGQYSWCKDMQEDLRKLESTLIQLQTVVAAAERRQTEDESQAELLRQLKDAVYEADDLLDEFEYQTREAQAKKAQGMVSLATSSSVNFAKRLVGRDKLRTKLIELLKKLDNVNKSADRFIQVAGLEQRHSDVQNNNEPSRVTGSIIPATKVFGRDKEKDEIISMLLEIPNKPSSSYTTIPIISIIGDGGIGKTTLAQLIYNNKKVEDHFDIMMWICVSDNFDERKLTRNILTSASHGKEEFVNINDFAILQRKLQTKLESTRFLLVLDDVWINEGRGKVLDQQMWEMVLAPLRHGKTGSAILMTTRMRIVAQMFDGTMKLVILNGLTDDKNWSLLKKYAFGDEIPHNYLELQQIGIQIVKRLNGSPLAAKLVGAMLKDTHDVGKWMEILEREMFDDVMSVLRLSYQRLPNYLKPCFAYCSIFPKDWSFDPNKLVLLWIAQDYIRAPDKNKKPMENIGMDYFNELLSRSFFQKVEQNSNVFYVIHDLIHDLAQSISMDECCRMEGGKHGMIMKPVRHLGVALNSGDEIRDFVAKLEKTSNLKKLRTLIFFISNGWSEYLPLSMFKEMRRLRVLDLGGLLMDDFPGTIGDLKHLRYLNVGRNTQCFLVPPPSLNLGCDGFQVLPKSLCGLYHLQVLAASGDLSFCRNIAGLIKFGELAHLDVRRLNVIVERKKGRYMGELKDAKVAKLGLWWLNKSTNGHEFDVEALEGLQPHPYLKELKIRGFQGSRSPSWLETNWLVNVETIHLTDCRFWDVLPPLGNLPLLKELAISGVRAVQRVDSGFYGIDNGSDGVRGFPSLQVLTFHFMSEWSEWCGPQFPAFPHLHRLRIGCCPRLMSFPLLPPALREIYIWDTGLISRLYLTPLPSSSSSKRFHVLTSVIPSGALHNHVLEVITELHIQNCKEPMPSSGLLGLVCLKLLRIDDCPELLASRIPDEGKEEVDGTGVLPSSLESLLISRCAITDKWMSKCLQGLASLSELEISFCTSLTSLPSAQTLHHLTALRKLKICSCEDLMSLGGLCTLQSLAHLEVEHCHKLNTLPEEDGMGILPSSLKSLVIHCRHVTERWMSRCIQDLASLSELEIHSATCLTSLPSAQVLHHLTALRKLEIYHCKDLMSLGGLHALHALRRLKLAYCPKLKSLTEEHGMGILPSLLESLAIHCCPVTDNWMSRCMHDLASLSELELRSVTCLTSLPSAQVLHHLTALRKLEIYECWDLMSLGGLHALHALRRLVLVQCPKLKSLSEEGLPTSIEHLHLDQQILEMEGPEWDKVSNIPHVEISF